MTFSVCLGARFSLWGDLPGHKRNDELTKTQMMKFNRVALHQLEMNLGTLEENLGVISNPDCDHVPSIMVGQDSHLIVEQGNQVLNG